MVFMKVILGFSAVNMTSGSVPPSNSYHKMLN